jgi:predicted phosphoribosyltransferase
MHFRDRRDAGRQLGERLRAESLTDPVVLALPRGGVPVGYEIAVALGAPLDVLVARKVGAPGHLEYGIGAIAEGGAVVMDVGAVRAAGLSPEGFARLAEAESSELERRVRCYRQGRPLPPLMGRSVVIVDDGLATGVTAEAALRSVQAAEPEQVVLAVPVAAPETAERLRPLVDLLVCLYAPNDFAAVGRWYQRFDQTSDTEVARLLAAAPSLPGARSRVLP